MKTGYLRQDESCHWYLVPKEYIERFDEVNTKLNNSKRFSSEYEDLCELFNDCFSEHRLDGGPYGLEVIIPE
jgi:hypothetical protein